MPSLTFDVRYEDGGGTGQQVDDTISVKLYEDSGATLKETRVLGTDVLSAIVEQVDGSGYIYRTSVDVTDYLSLPVKAVWSATASGNPITDFSETLAYPEGPQLTTDPLQDYVLAFLGWPTVTVEITTGQFNEIVKATMREYNRWVGRLRLMSINLLAAQAEYPIPEAGFRGVSKVEFVRSQGTPLVSDPLFGREYPRGQQMDLDQYALGISHWALIQRITGQEPEWVWDTTTQKLLINTGSQEIVDNDQWKVNVWYYEAVPMTDVPPQHQQMIYDLALAKSKRLLAQVLGKYSGMVPSPGGTVTLNAAELRAEGIKDEEAIIQQMRNLGLQTVVPEFG